MTTRKEIIAQIDDEIGRLERARDFLVAALAGSRQADLKTARAIASARRAKTQVVAQKRKQPATATAPAPITTVTPAPAPAPVQVKEEPQVHRVPPKRRIERRFAQTEKTGKSGAALSGAVPTGPVVVSAVEARKVQERVVQPPPVPAVSEPAPEIGSERTLGSLIQAFERRSGLSGLGTP
jgi:hypothetical protein